MSILERTVEASSWQVSVLQVVSFCEQFWGMGTLVAIGEGSGDVDAIGEGSGDVVAIGERSGEVDAIGEGSGDVDAIGSGCGDEQLHSPRQVPEELQFEPFWLVAVLGVASLEEELLVAVIPSPTTRPTIMTRDTTRAIVRMTMHNRSKESFEKPLSCRDSSSCSWEYFGELAILALWYIG